MPISLPKVSALQAYSYESVRIIVGQVDFGKCPHSPQITPKAAESGIPPSDCSGRALESVRIIVAFAGKRLAAPFVDELCESFAAKGFQGAEFQNRNGGNGCAARSAWLGEFVRLVLRSFRGPQGACSSNENCGSLSFESTESVLIMGFVVSSGRCPH